jgi:hypothetical protein
MTIPVRASSSRRSIQAIGLVLFGLGGAAASCSGGDAPKAGSSTQASSDAGSAPLRSGGALAVLRQVAAERPTIGHLSVDMPSALRLSGTRLIPKLVNPEKPFAIDVDLTTSYLDAVRVWPIGKTGSSVSLRPLVGGAAQGEITEDGHVVYKDVYGHADVIQSLDNATLHQTILLRDANSPEYMNWELKVGDPTLHPVEIDDGAIVMVEKGKVGRLKISAVTIVGADGQERHARFALLDNQELGLHIDQRGLKYPAAVTFSVSAPVGAEQFVTAPVQIKGRVMVILDTSGSMLDQFASGTNTTADGDGTSFYCDNDIGTAFNCGLGNVTCNAANGASPHWRLANAVTTPSRMYAAKQALTNVVTAQAGLLDFGLERYSNGTCPNGTYCCTPAPAAPTTTRGRCQTRGAYYDPGFPGTNDLTYNGGCGAAAAGGVVLVSPGPTSGAAILPWVDQVENFCDDGTGKPRNPELRGDGSTPLRRSVYTAKTNWYQPILAVSKGAGLNVASPLYDPLIDCRSYVLVVMTDGDDTCGDSSDGNEAASVTALRALNAPTNPPTIYTLGMGSAVTGLNTTVLNAMQVAGGSGLTTAAYAANQVDIEAAFAEIVNRTVKFEVCNGLDDNCNVRVDEGLGVYQECTVTADCTTGPPPPVAAGSTCDPAGTGRCTCTTSSQCLAGNSCASGFCRPACSTGVGECVRSGVQKCSGGAGACCVNDGNAACVALAPGVGTVEVCNGKDDNCNGIIDDVPFPGCQSCVNLPETCNGKDDDCDGVIDNVNGGVGAAASITGFAGSVATITGLTGMVAGNVGKLITVSGATTAGNNGRFTILSVTVPSSVTYTNPAGAAGDAKNGAISWSVENAALLDEAQVCGSNVGICKPGLTVCLFRGTAGATLSCLGGTNAQATDPCNGLDDNCDGVTDGNSQACYTGPLGPPTTLDVGICRGGTQLCAAAAGSGVATWGACVGQTTPAAETCNGLDDNCNGLTDDVAGVGTACCPVSANGKCGTGICTTGLNQCSGGSVQCIGGQGLGTEVCNNLDDNCNGVTDDVAGVGSVCCPSGKCGIGICTGGIQQCSGTALICAGSPIGPAVETCDNIDNDCNGLTDDLPGKGSQCCPAGISCGVGVCSFSTLQCVTGNAQLQCPVATGPTAEVCNGLDDNCNGITDDVATAGTSCCTSGLCGAGVCTSGVQKCVQNASTLVWAITCTGEGLPKTEICDQIDNNCDGQTDNATGVGSTCCNFKSSSGVDLCGVGSCTDGSLQCAAGNSAPVCTGGTGPVSETCNGLDDNCDGITDNLPGGTVGAACCPSGKCGTGLCTGGTLACASNGLLVCNGAQNPQAEVCDALDNNCNGLTDDVPGKGQPCCPTGVTCGVGICKFSTLQCVSGSPQLQCPVVTGPATEVCNGLDDDCNGITDDVAAAGTSCCTTGKCGAGICTTGVQKCLQNASTLVWAITCTGEGLPKTEVCDQIDNNCNGVTDDVSGVGSTCCNFKSSSGADLCGVGSCTDGSLQCAVGNAAPVCTGGTGPVAETCNGIDDNCDGITDNLPGGTVGAACCPSGKCGTGVCSGGILACGSNGLLVCNGAQNPQAEICDTLDNNCNGFTDDVPGSGQKCCPAGVPCGVGTCTGGTLQCAAGNAQLQCLGFQDAVAEVCNGLDDDCNGVTDDVAAAGTTCCTSGKCGAGVCTSGVQKCVQNTSTLVWAITCTGEGLPKTELCDQIDNNCNGFTDDVSGVGSSCCNFKTSAGVDLCGVGSCTDGSLQCAAGNTAPVCTGGTGPVSETCNGIDDNCDGITDNLPGGTVGAACCPSGKCGTGVCSGGTLACGSNGLLVCNGAQNPQAEICDTLDNNCNGVTDDVPGNGQKCCPAGVPCGTGICTGGTLQCATGNAQLQCLGFTDRKTEVCNGIDDDCNGLTDDVTGSGDPCCTSGKCGKGICLSGVQKCVKDATTTAWSLTCTKEVLPGAEVCDLIDNDCNGSTDDVTGVGNTCCQFKDPAGADLCGTGICTSGTLACVSGKAAPQCTKGVGPVPELCDGLDNNCNGVTDDLPGGTVGGTCCPSGACGVGVCTAGHLQCGPGGIVCAGAINKSGELCDGVDNDCNGTTDDVPGLGTKCCPSGHCGTGICTSGTLTCTTSGPAGQQKYSLLCAGGQDAITETCNGADDNCNGITDDVPGLGQSCCPSGSPAGPAPAACNKGVCRPGVTKCDVASQSTVCSGGRGPEANACDGRDNNCDGSIDERAEIDQDPLIGVVCGEPKPPADHPPCKAGVTICQGNKPVCSGPVGPSAEACNGIDENCDGVTDEQAPCAVRESCIEGACRAPCGGGEFSQCPGGLVCRANFCVPPVGSGAGGGGNGNAGSGNAGSGNAGSGNGGNAGSGNAGNGNAGNGNAGSGNAGSGNAGGAGNAGAAGNGTDGGPSGSGASGNGSGASGNGSGASGNGSGASGNGSGASGNGSGASGNGSGASGNGSGASGNGSGASGNGSGASGNGSGAAQGSTGGGPPRRQAFGLATGGGGCACRTGGGQSSPLQGMSLAALIGLCLVARRRNRRAA